MIIETGLQVAKSDSYTSRADYIAYAANIGVVIASTVAADEQLIKAAIYIGRHEANLKGSKVARDQSMAWPRNNVSIEGFTWSGTEIPRQLILCQMAFALDLNASIDLYNRPVNPNLAVTSERVEGAVAVQYAVGTNTGQKLSQTSTGDALLASLLKSNGMMLVRA